MGNGEGKTFDKKFFIYIAIILFSALVSFFTIKGAIEIDIVKLYGNDEKLELKIQSNEVFVKRDIEIIKEDIDEIKKGIKQLVDLRLAESGN